MGLFGKIFKGITKVFRSVGKFIKKGFKKFGKFMNKLGIAGQIGMMFVSYGLSTALMKGLTTVGGKFMGGLSKLASPVSGATGGLNKAAGVILKGAQRVADVGRAVKGGVTGVFGTITDSVKGVLKPVMKQVGSVFRLTDPLPEGQFFSTVGNNLTEAFQTGGKNLRMGGQGLKDAILGRAAPDMAGRSIGAAVAGTPVDLELGSAIPEPAAVKFQTDMEKLTGGDMYKPSSTKVAVTPSTTADRMYATAARPESGLFDVKENLGKSISTVTAQSLLAPESNLVETPSGGSYLSANTPEISFGIRQQSGLDAPVPEFQSIMGGSNQTFNQSYNTALEDILFNEPNFLNNINNMYGQKPMQPSFTSY